MALALGKSLGEIDAIPARELAEWVAFSRLEPFGCEIDDQRAEIIAAATYNVNRSSHSQKPVVPGDIIVRNPEEYEQRRKRDMASKLLGALSGLNRGASS